MEDKLNDKSVGYACATIMFLSGLVFSLYLAEHNPEAFKEVSKTAREYFRAKREIALLP